MYLWSDTCLHRLVAHSSVRDVYFIKRTLCPLLYVCCVLLYGPRTPSGEDNHSINQQTVYLLLESFNSIVSVFFVQKPWTTVLERLWSMDNNPLDHRSIGGSIERLQLFWKNFVQCENEEAKVSDCKRFQCISVRISFVVCPVNSDKSYLRCIDWR